MNIDKERGLFESWHNIEFSDKLEWDAINGEYLDYSDNVLWKAWQASANREGYKLIPVEPSKEKLKEIEEKCFEHPDCFGIDCPIDVIYTAIVGEME